MATNNYGNRDGFTNTLRGGLNDKGSQWESTPKVLTDALADVGTMRAALQDINATSYSDARLDAMTYNDMRYALRLELAPDTINDSGDTEAPMPGEREVV